MSVEVSGILVAAHELKAPLCLMRQLTLAMDLTDDPLRKKRLQTELRETSERALNQVNDLTKIARLEDGFFNSEPLSVRGVCAGVLQEIEPLFTFEHHAIKTTYKNTFRLASANRDLLHSIVYNFCVNALRYSDRNTTSQLTVADHQGKIRVSVRDYGPALPTKLWRELKRGRVPQPTAISMRPGSSGLGLYIASAFAEHMHATIGAIRHRDGTSFFVELPVSHQLTFATLAERKI